MAIKKLKYGTNEVVVDYAEKDSKGQKITDTYLTKTDAGTTYEAKFDDGSATVATVSNDVVTLKAGVAQSGGKISNSSGDNITLAKVAKTGSYGDVTDKPILNTSNTTAQTAAASETITGTINLHKVSKTGNYGDLLDRASISISGSGSAGDGEIAVVTDLTATGTDNHTLTKSYGNAATKTYVDTQDTKLSNRIDALEGRGRFLSSWDATTGLPGTYPEIPSGASYPYTYSYKSGDYYIVDTVGSSNKKPSGASITKASATASWVVGSAAESNEIYVNDYYLYDGEAWVLVHNTSKEAVWGKITGTLSNQTDLQTALDGKKNVQTAVADSGTGYVSAVTQDTQGVITVTKTALPTVSVTNETATTPTGNTVAVVASGSASGHTITNTRVNVPTTAYVDSKLELGDVDVTIEYEDTTGTVVENGLVNIEVGSDTFKAATKAYVDAVGAAAGQVDNVTVNGGSSHTTKTNKVINLSNIATLDDAQTFAETKTFTKAPVLSSTTASTFLKVDASKNVISAGTTGIVSTAGSEKVNIDGSSLNVVTRDTAQTISGVKTFAAASDLVLSNGYTNGTYTFNNPTASGTIALTTDITAANAGFVLTDYTLES